MKRWNFWLSIPLAVVACQNSVNPSNTAAASSSASSAAPLNSASPEAAPAALSVSQVLQQPADSAVQSSGLYFGWNGPCKGKPPTRSAWQLVESNAADSPCIYVDGPAVPGVSPNAPDANVLVVVRGKYRVDGKTSYIQADTVEKK
jgi:hypothetical protein